jgi:hypothetical protein
MRFKVQKSDVRSTPRKLKKAILPGGPYVNETRFATYKSPSFSKLQVLEDKRAFDIDIGVGNS